MFPSLSVTTHWELLPELPLKVMAPSGMLSAIPSPTTNSNGPPSSIPPSGWLRYTVIGLAVW